MPELDMSGGSRRNGSVTNNSQADLNRLPEPIHRTSNGTCPAAAAVTERRKK
jgi:hypothetical protein